MAAIKMKLTPGELVQLENLLERALDHKQLVLYAGEDIIEELDLELDREDKEVRETFGKEKVFLFAPGIEVEAEDEGEDDPDADYDEDETEQQEDA